MSKRLRRIIRIVASIALAVSVGFLIFYAVDNSRARKTEEKIDELKENTEEIVVPQVLDEYAALVKENPDTIGWLKIEDTSIDNVVMYAPDTVDKYLRTDFYGNYSTRGCLFISEGCDPERSDNLIINGHHMKDGSMFGTLMSYADEEFYKTHKTFRFDTIYEKQTYEVVAAIETAIPPEGEDSFRYYQYFESGDRKKFNEYKKFITENALYDTGVELQYGDKLLTLTTCAYHTADGRFIVVARKLST